MKKKLAFLIVLICSIFYIPSVSAASASIYLSPSSKTVVVGSSFSVTVKVSSGVNIGAIRFNLNYDSSVISLSSGSASILDEFTSRGTSGVRNKSYTYTFKARKKGNTNISVAVQQMTSTGEEGSVSNINPSVSSSKITVITQAELEATYSKNNNLSSLGIDGYELSPAFSADQTEYSVELKPETENINIVANKADSTASVIGAGTVDVTDGLNVLKVEVTAQNGNIKTYTINATVKELDPIDVEVDSNKYTVVRAKKALTFDNILFTQITIPIKGIDVPAFFNEKTNTTLVGLKDSEGKISYYKVVDDKYTKYNEIKLGNSNLMVADSSSATIPENYKDKKVTINNMELDAYASSDSSRFCIIYCTNLETGTTEFYSYDNVENTIQRFDNDTYKLMEKEINKLKILNYIFGTLSILLFIAGIVFLINIINKNPTKFKKNKIKNDDKKEEIISEIKEQTDEVPEEVAEKIVEEQIEEIQQNEEKQEEKPKDIIDEMNDTSDIKRK